MARRLVCDRCESEYTEASHDDRRFHMHWRGRTVLADVAWSNEERYEFYDFCPACARLMVAELAASW